MQKSRLFPIILLAFGVLIFSMANSVIAKLGQLGAHHLVDGTRNPISFCNVLFTGNIIAGLTLLGIHRKEWTKEKLSKLAPKDWINMLIFAVIAGVIGPSLFFLGLMLTEVINVVLISVLDIPLTLILAYIFFRERPKAGTVIASLFAIAGIIVIFTLHQFLPMSMEMKMTMLNIGDGKGARFLASIPRGGEICIALATFFTVFSVEFSRKYFEKISPGIYTVFRMFAGTIMYFFIVIIMLGWAHFTDVFNPYLIEWMLVYGAGIIAIGLYVWDKGIKGTTSSDLALINAFQPITGIIFAFLILGEIPELGQYAGGIVIMVGIAIGVISKFREEKPKPLDYRKPRSFSGV